MTFLEAAETVLHEANTPLHYEEIAKLALTKGLIVTSGKTPAATLNSEIAVELRANGDRSHFVRVRPGVYALREWNLASHDEKNVSLHTLWKIIFSMQDVCESHCFHYTVTCAVSYPFYVIYHVPTGKAYSIA
jgi:hypothetical protein